ncbi:metallophosphoesterase [Aerococcaceae bacterium zg-B36]|uniref:RNA ligase n=1 Tax=Aerococcaceae bacterium zg-252 TaxID=2796928 RepID=UPI001BD82253|nr:metallophosphoesterase [Aerococcaceae bacterium zg-B36]
MRQLVLLRGVMGVGKSTWIKENGLEPYTLSADSIRTLFASPIMNEEQMTISHHFEKKVWDLLFECLENRMQNGDFTIIDATHVKQTALSTYKELASRYNYRVYIVDFDKELETILEQNNQRPEYKRITENTIRSAYIKKQESYVANWFTVLDPETALEKLQWRKSDCTNKYDKIHVIGDIHGCYSTLMKYMSGTSNNESDCYINDNDLYIFTGDYVDRGSDNDKVIKYLLKIYNKPNVVLLEGNHEAHIKNFVHKRPIKSKEFYHITLPQIMSSGISESDLKQLSRKFAQIMYFDFHGKTYFVTHGGVPKLPENINMISSNQYIKGVGTYETNIDRLWQNNSKENEIQIHGHRNIYLLPADRYDRSINLEGKVEFGGALRVAILDKNGVTVKKVKSEYISETNNDILTSEHDIDTISSFIKTAQSSNLIRVKEHNDNISAFNFTRNAFKKGLWNDLTVRSRGLFINTKDEYVSARGYDKFFNDSEIEREYPHFLQKLKTPITMYKKYNGFLALMSYDKGTDCVKYYTKSMIWNDFSEEDDMYYVKLAKNMIEKHVSESNLKVLQDFSKENNVTIVFEIVNPQLDPHIIDGTPKVVLLDAIYNDLDFKKVDYNTLKSLVKNANEEYFVKEIAYQFDDLSEFLIKYESLSNDFSIEEEGYVIEDATGFMFKMKLPYYNFWKFIRNNIGAMKQNNYTIFPLNKLYLDWQFDFFFYVVKNVDDEMKKNDNLIKIRNEWFKNKNSK